MYLYQSIINIFEKNIKSLAWLENAPETCLWKIEVSGYMYWLQFEFTLFLITSAHNYAI